MQLEKLLNRYVNGHASSVVGVVRERPTINNCRGIVNIMNNGYLFSELQSKSRKKRCWWPN